MYNFFYHLAYIRLSLRFVINTQTYYSRESKEDTNRNRFLLFCVKNSLPILNSEHNLFFCSVVKAKIPLVEVKIILSQVYFRQVEIFVTFSFFVFNRSILTFEEFVILIILDCWKITWVANLIRKQFYKFGIWNFPRAFYIDSGSALPSRTPYFTAVLCESSCFARVRCFFNNRIYVSEIFLQKFNHGALVLISLFLYRKISILSRNSAIFNLDMVECSHCNILWF